MTNLRLICVYFKRILKTIRNCILINGSFNCKHTVQQKTRFIFQSTQRKVCLIELFMQLEGDILYLLNYDVWCGGLNLKSHSNATKSVILWCIINPLHSMCAIVHPRANTLTIGLMCVKICLMLGTVSLLLSMEFRTKPQENFLIYCCPNLQMNMAMTVLRCRSLASQLLLQIFVCHTASIYLDLPDDLSFGTTSSHIDVHSSNEMLQVRYMKFGFAIMHPTHHFSIDFAHSF